MNILKKSVPEFLEKHYYILKNDIKKRLDDFRSVPESEYFYELCFCLCTPQSKAENALQVIEKLKAKDFFKKKFNPEKILFDKKHYIRFHKTKSQRLLNAIDIYPEVLKTLKSEITNIEKRNFLWNMITGYGLKETSHFLRNIGYTNLAILDRHILKHLVLCGVLNNIPKSVTPKLYFKIENRFIEYSNKVSIPLDELDLLFWSYETGKILK